MSEYTASVEMFKDALKWISFVFSSNCWNGSEQPFTSHIAYTCIITLKNRNIPYFVSK